MKRWRNGWLAALLISALTGGFARGAESSAQALLTKLTQKYGVGYLYEVDEKLKLVFATNTGKEALDEIRRGLTAHAQALRNDLFSHDLDDYVTVAIPKEWRGSGKGFFNPEERSVIAKAPGAALFHEFTHALHFADQKPLGQFHQNWIIEGLAAVFESSRVLDGHLVPQSNYRLKIIQELARRGQQVPWETYVKFSQKEFMKRPGNHYSQARYMLMYLLDRGLLKKWYDVYTAGFAQDATGARALEQVLGKSLVEAEKDWVEWVVKLPPFTGGQEQAKGQEGNHDTTSGERTGGPDAQK
jgi:hypothetical protein